ncbi:adenosylcobinamide-GDP ribazoletransferase [Reichenbachiella ulvae]|uniref:Adenosylcobinamide-GDP ribazoletransferase n=1 Tax=Reichenbachiella ulvae TaxID=2980104 RepID=A0ABT3CPV9_9BACT|nr:adenosylcobinamide-GDP ribazoletransferase [Reichenbachiella ulvae]MCV9385758.1 adenosylcobinamide-GDP ribazoletransferase [Reichenbachiella ulvae]
MIKKEIHVFFTALMFYTRIPCPKWVDHNPDYLNLATRYFPLIGWIVGGLGAIILYASSLLFSIEIALLLSMITTILITGGFHEDGFADVCDGFGGGWTRDKILKIMKDSVLGAYGVIGLILILTLKFFSLRELVELENIQWLCGVMLIAHSLSRTNAVWLMSRSQYVRENEDSKAKPIAKKMTSTTLITASVLGLTPLLLFLDLRVLSLMPVLVLVNLYLNRYFNKWIGGYTGDCLGAVQQISEIAVYLSFYLIWKFI